jgi:hypothetical protein
MITKKALCWQRESKRAQAEIVQAVNLEAHIRGFDDEDKEPGYWVVQAGEWVWYWNEYRPSYQKSFASWINVMPRLEDLREVVGGCVVAAMPKVL